MTAAAWLALVLVPDAGRAHLSARVTGTFTMRARVTTAVNVPGEYAGQELIRRWVIIGHGCTRDVCRSLELDRQRGDGLESSLTLHRSRGGGYAGGGVFEVALECNGHVYPDGSRAPYVITLKVARARLIGGIRFARLITASYVNAARSDSTPCPLGPSHDAAVYTGTITGGLPRPPVAAFTARARRSGAVRFVSRARPGRGNGRIVRRTWNFGDPGSPYGDTSTLRRPIHVFSAPGRYRVALTVTARDGLSATVAKTITVG
jgi:hypothetical protein